MTLDGISAQTTVRVATNQVSCDLAGEAVVLSLSTGTYYGLDPVGAHIWQLIQEPRTVRAVRDALVDAYDVDAERCEASIIRLLTELRAHGLVDVHEDPTVDAHDGSAPAL